MEDKIGSLRSFLYAAKIDSYQRVGHRAIQIGHHIMVFGGTNANNEFITTILRINSENITVDLKLDAQLRLEEFSLFSYKEAIYLWGGHDPAGFSNRLYKYTGSDFELIMQSGQIPSPRSRHASFFYSKRYLLIQGGMGKDDAFFNDFFILDCQSMVWSKVNIDVQLPQSANTAIFWSGGRGFFVIGETFDPITRKINYQYRIYELRFTDIKQFKMSAELMSVTESAAKPLETKKESAIILVDYESPYLMLVGGEIVPPQPDELHTINTFSFRDIWIFNLETLEWMASNVRLASAGFGFEAIFFQERLYLIGGVSRNYREMANTIEVIDINSDCLEAKLCKVCREMYGVKEYSPYNKQLAIKFEYQEKPRAFFTVETMNKLAKYMQHPFSAIGLLIDNCLNLNGTLIDIEFKHFDPQREEIIQRNSFLEAGSLIEKTEDGKLKMKYNYIKITDDTCGFTQNEIVECLCSFGLKTEKLTTDKKYEQQLQIRKEYGVNIKLGALRLAQSCLCVAKTEDDTIFVCYFSTIEENVGQRFQIYSYFISDQVRSSDINYDIIRKNVGRHLPGDYEQLEEGVRTKVYLLNLQKEEMVKEMVDFNNFDFTYKVATTRTFTHLRAYLESLYFKPYIGRTIRLEGSPIKFKYYPQIFKKDEKDQLITKLTLSLKDNLFKHYAFYKFHSPKYPHREIMIYHENRLIFSADTAKSNICGFIIVPPTISIDICKTRIESHEEEFNLSRFIEKLKATHTRFLPEGEGEPSKRVKQ